MKFLLIFLLSFSSLLVNGAVGFKATDTAGCAPLVARFTNTTTGATSYSWNLGNGVTPTSTDASTTYLAAGTYTVTLTAYNGSVLLGTSSMIVRIYGKPSVNFSVSDSTACKNTSVTFTSTSTPNAWGGISYIWNFGDGSSSTATSPVYAYPAPGNYNVTLFATNVKGCSNSFTRSGYMTVFPSPAANYNAVTTTLCSAPGTASFINTTTGKAPMTYTWLFGDGDVSTASSPAHTYTAPAQYDVKLIVNDGNGCYDSLMQLNYITIGNLKAGFAAVTNSCLFTPNTFINTSTPHISSQWDFGDGGMSFSDTPVYSYAYTGTYKVKLVIYDGSCYDSVTHTITITKPTGSFTISPICGPPYSVQTFTGTVPSGCTIAWDFGDKSTGTGATVTHTYHPPALGTLPPPNPDPVYTVSMIITSSLGCNDTVKMIDTVKNMILNLASTLNTAGCIPLKPVFVAIAQYNIINPSPPCYKCDLLTLPYPKSIISYLWDFGDGSPKSTSPSPAHYYTIPGIYYAKCHVVTADGCSADQTTEIDVGTPQSASFTMSKTHVCAGQPITYTSTSTSVALIDHYSWTFGDGKSYESDVTAITTVHKSEMPGIHTSSLTVIYNGCKSIDVGMVDTIDAPNATISNQYTCIPDNGMTYTDGSIGDDTHLWQLGDGDTSTAKSLVHYYASLSSYPVSLTTYNKTTGCRDTSNILIELQRLAPTITPYHSNICHDLIDTITTYIKTTDSTNPVKAVWYNNGVITDTHMPVPIAMPPPAPAPFADTIYHALRNKGNNNITLILTDNHGCLDTAAKNIVVVKPTDSFSFTPATTCPSTAVNFTDYSTDVTGFSVTKYHWSFGDGTVSASGPAVSHTYTAAGTYTVKTMVTDNLGCTDTLTGPIHPLVHKPAAGFIASSTYTCKGATISFNNTSTGGVSWLWVFGDGGTSTLALPTHTFTAVGKYTVQLIAFDTYGCTDTLTKKNLISINPLPKASFYMDDSFAVCAPLNVNFINTSTGSSFCTWSFGDGATSVSVYPSDIYTAPGVYKIILKVSNSYGCIDTAIGHAVVFGYAGAFSYTPSSACASLPVHFSSKVSGVTSIVWDFNDGLITLPSLSDTISHSYRPGAYIPKLILTDVLGCTNISEGIDTIKVDTVIAKFGSIPNPVCQNSSVTFHDSSSCKYSSPEAWLWTFGPGATSTARTPIYSYTVSGTIPVTLLVTDTFGCTGSITGNITVNPVPAAIAGPVNICLGLATTLSDDTTGGKWSSGNTAVATIGPGTGLVTSHATGTSTITYTLVTGCKTTVTATVNPLPSPIAGVKKMCIGDTIRLSDLTPGGTWSSSETTIAAIGPGPGVVTAVTAGTATITYQLPTGCLAAVIIKIDSTPVVISGPLMVCTGDTITLSDAPGGGAWSASNTSVTVGLISGTVTGKAAGTSTITYTLPTGCKTTTTVKTNPSPSGITGKTDVCAGLTTVLSDTTTGGTWSSNNTASATVSTGMVSGIAAGTTTITFALATGCLAVKSITVNPLPSPIKGITNVCVSQTDTFTDATAGGKWSSPYPSVVIDTVGIVTGISSGTATITYTLSTGCIATKPITVNPVPSVITGTGNICIGLTTTLHDDTTGGNWYSPDLSISIGAGTGIATGIAIGTATVSYTLFTGCYATTTVTVNPLPPSIKGITKVCAGDTTPLSDSVSGGNWSSSSLSIASVDGSGLVKGVSAGTATITYTSGVGCIAMTTVTVNALIAPITGKNALCKGATTTLFDPTTGGTWSSSDSTIASIDATGNVTGLATGSAVITYIAVNTCRIATSNMVVNPLPDAGAITGKTKLCSGASEILKDSVKGGIWTSGNNSIATVNASGAVTGISAGITNITFSYTNSCGTAKTSITLTINPTPAIAHIITHPDSSLCARTLYQNFGADAPEPAGAYYAWSADNASIYATSSTRQYCLASFNSPGIATIRLSTALSTTDCASYDSLIFNISSGYSPDPVVVYYAPEFVCKDNTSESYQWGYDDVTTLDSALLPGFVNQNYYNPNPDFLKKYYWVLTYHNGCLQKSYYNAPTGINITSTENNADIIIFPNPAGLEIHMELKGINKQGKTDVKLFDILGKERKVCIIDDGTGSMILSGLPQGVYMLRFSRNGINFGSKIFVKN